ncbi:aldehyde dehydrogenase2 [Zea mays]|uniref:Aldehyde dehydrogenase2 n=1 Tax=Zea mays TaxID=4577 RepID=A0A1D6Q9N0_MAIZE|nr:aldehyde dehydrogenase2 [Zea mays]
MPTKKMILEFLKGRMGYVARNLAAIVGSAVASKPSRAAVLVVWEHWPKCPLVMCCTAASRCKKDKSVWILYCVSAVSYWLSRTN